MLRRGHREAVGADEVASNPSSSARRVVGRDRAPELGPEAGDEVDAAHRRPRLAQRRDRRTRSAWAQPARRRARGRRATTSRARRCPAAGVSPRSSRSAVRWRILAIPSQVPRSTRRLADRDLHGRAAASSSNHRWAVLATGRRDGLPQQSMVGYTLDGEGRICLHAGVHGEGSQPRRLPRVSLTVPDGRVNVAVYGPAEIIEADPERAERAPTCSRSSEGRTARTQRRSSLARRAAAHRRAHHAREGLQPRMTRSSRTSSATCGTGSPASQAGSATSRRTGSRLRCC